MPHEAYTIVADCCEAGEKGAGSWVYASKAVAHAAMAYYPPSRWKLQVRKVFLDKPLAASADRAFEKIPGLWFLHEAARFEGPPPKPEPKKRKKAKKPSVEIKTLFG